MGFFQLVYPIIVWDKSILRGPDGYGVSGYRNHKKIIGTGGMSGNCGGNSEKNDLMQCSAGRKFDSICFSIACFGAVRSKEWWFEEGNFVSFKDITFQWYHQIAAK